MSEKNAVETPKAVEFSVVENDGAYAMHANGKAMQTPGKHAFILNSKPLADAICWEWQSNPRYSSSAMPLTALAYTAIDRIAGQKEDIIEALLVYVDTDTLSYRDSNDESTLAKRQKEMWDPVLKWGGSLLGHDFNTTSGIMPVEQSLELLVAFRKELEKLDHTQLAAASVLASCCSSMILALAVVLNEVDGENAFILSRLEEDTQAEQWGQDEEANSRAQRLKDEIVAATRFLRLLERQ